MKWFILFSSITLITEVGNYFHVFPNIHHSNHWTFNIETVFEFYFFSFIFYKTLNKKRNKFFIKCFVWTYPIILLGSFLTVQLYYVFHTYTYILGELYLIVLCFLYYNELYTDNNVKKLSTLPEFWIITGLFIFTVGVLPYMILLNYLNKNLLTTSFYFREYILGTLNIVMYTMFSIGLFCSIWTRK
jgi:hypothetical protein